MRRHHLRNSRRDTPNGVFALRLSYAMYQQMEMRDLIAKDADDYVRLADSGYRTDPGWR